LFQKCANVAIELNRVVKAQPKNIIGPSLRRARNRRGWSQADLATKLQLQGLDMRRSAVGKIEARIRVVPDYELYVILRVIGYSYEELCKI